MVAITDGADRSTDVLMADGDSQIAVQVCELRSELQVKGVDEQSAGPDRCA